MALLAAIVVFGAIAFALTRPPNKVGFLRWGGADIDTLMESGFNDGVAKFGLVGTDRLANTETDGQDDLRQLSADGNRLIVTYSFDPDAFNAVVRAFPETRYAMMDRLGSEPNVSYVVFDDQESSYLAGAAAALVSKSGTIGFIGGVDVDVIWRFQAGYEAGAKSIRPDIQIFSAYLTEPPDFSGFVDQRAGHDEADNMFNQGADVVFAAAGNSGYGAMDDAATLSGSLGRQLWVIGVDADQYDAVGSLPGLVDPDRWRAHILTSVVKRWDNAIYSVLDDFAHDKLAAGLFEIRLDSGGVDISYTGGFIDDLKPKLDEIRAQIIGGQIAVPCVPTDKADQTAEGGQPLCRR
jgi:basic membrane protein A